MKSPAQLDLLGWQAPEVTVQFSELQVRSASLAGRIAKAVSATLKDSTLSREEVCAAMGAFLGERISKNALDAYASEARADHTIPVARLIALMHATGDRRLLQMIAEPMGWAVIDARYLALVDLAAVREQEDRMHAMAKGLRLKARAEGVL